MDKTKREYRSGVNHLKEWLDNAETLIASPVNCNLQELRSRVKALDVSSVVGFVYPGHLNKFSAVALLGRF